MSINIGPLGDRVVVQPIEVDEKTSGGIILPGKEKEKPQEGKIVAVGPGKYLDNGTLSTMSVKVGDKILFGKYSGTEFELNDEKCLIMREDDIMGIVGA